MDQVQAAEPAVNLNRPDAPEVSEQADLHWHAKPRMSQYLSARWDHPEEAGWCWARLKGPSESGVSGYLLQAFRIPRTCYCLEESVPVTSTGVPGHAASEELCNIRKGPVQCALTPGAGSLRREMQVVLEMGWFGDCLRGEKFLARQLP